MPDSATTPAESQQNEGQRPAVAAVSHTAFKTPPHSLEAEQSVLGALMLNDEAWFNVEVVSPFRAAGVQRFIAAAEVASEEYFNPVVPEDLAERLRQLTRAAS